MTRWQDETGTQMGKSVEFARPIAQVIYLPVRKRPEFTADDLVFRESAPDQFMQDLCEVLGVKCQ